MTLIGLLFVLFQYCLLAGQTNLDADAAAELARSTNS